MVAQGTGLALRHHSGLVEPYPLTSDFSWRAEYVPQRKLKYLLPAADLIFSESSTCPTQKGQRVDGINLCPGVQGQIGDLPMQA